jgi:uncharacterized protein HemY
VKRAKSALLVYAKKDGMSGVKSALARLSPAAETINLMHFRGISRELCNMEDRPLFHPNRLRLWCILPLLCGVVGLAFALPAAAAEPDANRADAAAAETNDEHATERAELEEFLNGLVKIRRTGDGWSYGMQFDMERLIDELGRQGVLRGAGFTRVLTLWMNLQYGLRVGSVFKLESDDDSMDEFRLGRVKFTANGTEAEAFVLCHSLVSDSWWSRIWLIKRDGRWRMFDHQRLDSGIRFTTSLAEIGTSDQKDAQSWRRSKELVDLAWQSLQYGYGDTNAIQVNLQTARPLAKHPATEVRRRLYEVQAAVSGYVDQDATGILLESLAKMPNVADQQPIVPLLQARYAFGLDQYDAAIKSASEFISQVGPDQEACSILGRSLLELKKNEAAAQAFRQGLSVDRAATDCLTGLALALPAGESREIGEHFARLPDPRESFEGIAIELNARDRADALLAVVDAYRKVDQEDPDADYYEAMAWRTKGEPRRAAELLKGALMRVSDTVEQGYYQQAYYQAMIDARLADKAYRDADNPTEAFRKLAELLDRTDKQGQMRTLIALHREKFPRDPLVYYYLGGLEQQEHHLDEADEVLALGMRHAVDAETLEMLRSRRVEVAFNAKRALEAYRAIPPRRKTFLDLAGRLRDSKQADVLEKLVALHRQQDSRDPSLPMWDAEVYWLKKDYAAAAKSLIAGREKLPESEIPLWTYEDRLMRSLIRAERFEEAENIAQGIKARDDESWFLLMVYAVWQDEDAAMEMAQVCIDSGNYRVNEMYDDEDIGPALKTEVFAKFRAKFPQPKE